MNLALPAILIILGILPGIVFFHSYFSGRFPRQLADISAVSEVALYVIFAIPLGMFSLWLFGLFGNEFNYQLVAKLMAGTPSAETGQQLGEYLKANWDRGALLYLGCLAGSLVLGHVCRRIVWNLRLDVSVRFLRLKHEWYYTLTGRLPWLPKDVLASVDLMLDHPDGSLLVQGIVAHIEIDHEGKIDQLILEGARRGKDRGAAFHWKEIPGSRFVVTGACIRTINMRYIELEVVLDSSVPPDPPPDQADDSPSPSGEQPMAE